MITPTPSSPDDNSSDGGNRMEDSSETTHVELRTELEREGTSRLIQEFHLEKTLGRGGFGDVLKVRNKLDKQVYAIKRIMINPRSRLDPRKITREAKLLSRLNHEHIVRYYNAWVEVSNELALSETSSGSILSSTPTTTSPSPPSDKSAQPTVTKKAKNMLDLSDDIEKNAPQAADSTAEWSISRSLNTSDHKSDDSSSDDDDDDDGGFYEFTPCMRMTEQSQDSVGFEVEEDGSRDSGDHNTTESDSQAGTPMKSESEASARLWSPESKSPEEEEELPRLSCLYIQMQYCEKSTLRHAIDQGLCKHMDKVWRYFREISEGLLYIHEQKMIHRDLKPDNIFLDANDLVKIGDFGLATTDIVKQKTGLADSTMATPAHTDPYTSRSGVGSGDGDLTGEVGTALYVSPEMMKGGSNIRYDQKVDIYSLGIIFFEMVYKTLGTSMERYIILSSLRKQEVIFPEDFNRDGDLNNQAALIRQMLSHDPSQRPSSKDLLQSPHLPAVQEAEAQFNQRVEEAVKNPDSHIYRRILTQFFDGNASRAMDMTYNMDQTKAKHIHNPVKSMLLHDTAKERLERVFRSHGAVRINTPLLMPRPQQYVAIEQLVPCFLDKSGAVVNLPFDLRLPFARYVAHNAITNLRRYSIERVYRQLKAQSLHPREVVECAFDIITTTKNCQPDAHLLVVVQHVIDAFPVLQGRAYEVCMNHTKLIEAILLNAGVPDDKLSTVIGTLLSHPTITEETITVTMSQHNISVSTKAQIQLKTYLDIQADLSMVTSKLRPLTRQNNKVGGAAKAGLNELESIQSVAWNLGLKMKITVWLCMVHNFQQHSGLMFQVYYQKQRKKQKSRAVHEIIASGGRYDILVSEFTTAPLGQRALGVSIAFDIVVAALAHETALQTSSPCDVVVCAIDNTSQLNDRLHVTKILLAAGIRTEMLYEPLEDTEEQQDRCRASGIPFLVFLQDPCYTHTRHTHTRDKESEGGIFVTLKMLDSKGSRTEKKLNATELVEVIQQRLAAKKLTMNTSQKHRHFVAEPMGKKPVTDLAGIGEFLGGRLKDNGLLYSSQYRVGPNQTQKSRHLKKAATGRNVPTEVVNPGSSREERGNRSRQDHHQQSPTTATRLQPSVPESDQSLHGVGAVSAADQK